MFKRFAPFFLLLAIAGLASGQDAPGKLHELDQAGAYRPAVGDMIQVSVKMNSDSAPNFRVGSIKVEVKGEVFAGKPTVVLIPRPGRTPDGLPISGGTSTLRAYLPVDKAGDATVTVTPIGPDGKSKDPIVMTFTAGQP